jgi:predicted GTPase
MGYCGSGKTSLLNNLCKKNYVATFSKGSLTSDIAYDDSAYLPPKLLRLFDTPGITSNYATLEYAEILYMCLTKQKVNSIIINAALANRFDVTIS